MFREYVKIILERDRSPRRGQESIFQYVFQCKLRIWFSLLILFIFCTAGIVLLGIQAGMINHLCNLQRDPFSSAIHIQGRFTRADLNQLKDNLYYNKDKKEFEKKKSQNAIPVIKAVYPYKWLYLRFIKRDGNSMTQNTYKVQSVKIPRKQQSNDADCLIKHWVQESLLFGDIYFSLEEDRSVDEHVILSKELYQTLDYQLDQKNQKPQLIEILSFIGPNILEIRGKNGDNLFSKLTDEEKIRYTLPIPLLDVAKRLPGCDMLIPESLFHNLKNDFYYPCKQIHFFDIKQDNNSKLDQTTIDTITKWLHQQDFSIYFQEIYIDPDHYFIKVRFIDMIFDDNYQKNVTKCNIQLKCMALSKKINSNVKPYFGDDAPIYEPQTNNNYKDAFLYIKKSPDIINNMRKLSFYLSSHHSLYIDTHQIMTLKQYRQELAKMNIILLIVLSCIGILTFLYIFTSFSLFLQTKMHRIGMLKSYGLSRRVIYMIYLWEAIRSIAWALLGALIFGFFVWYFKSYIQIPFAFQSSYFISYSIGIVLIASLAALVATVHIAMLSPYKLISYKL